MLPVLEYRIKYFKPAFYDDLLKIETQIDKMPGARVHFFYKTFRENGEQVNEAETTLVFVNVKTGRPVEAPAHVLEKFKEYFKQSLIGVSNQAELVECQAEPVEASLMQLQL